ncbi:hypothetical protein SAMD00020551_0324 [Mesobacillus selenatarsenatis SF-1]|uniref:Uncharacterized protein n=1 Tax=Mesobacillus selenatarsenatis (strain DSM 18680 / JCM 14380 / FERM P-15431 / SF-1) TaxID=1321606 RepID=A0A0A8WX45_MESS1|nr:hypothetical protein SAMD00020551_0324 [Mesobacillus selenatarsenatis SF-1]
MAEELLTAFEFFTGMNNKRKKCRGDAAFLFLIRLFIINSFISYIIMKKSVPRLAVFI